MQKKKILVVSQLPKEAGGTYTTGIARVMENLYQKDFGEGLELYWYFTNVPEKIASAKCAFNNQYNGYKIVPLQMVWNFISHPINTIKEWVHYKRIDGINPLRYDFYKVNFKKVLKKIKPDLIHLHGAGVSPLYYANVKTKIPFLITFHGVMYNKEDETSWHFKPGYLATMQMVDYFTVLNHETKRKALSLGMPEDKCTTIPNGVDSSRFYFSEEQREKLRIKYEVVGNTLVFMTTGLVIDRKGQYDFILALESLGIDYQYWIIGKGPDEQKIVDYISKHNLEHKVKLLGYIDGRELYKYLSAADVYAHVSTTEGQALSEIEAYAAGLRVIVRKEIAGTVIGDVKTDTDNYYVLDLNTVDNVGLKKWLNNGISTRISRGKFDWSEIARQYGDLYKRLLS